MRKYQIDLLGWIREGRLEPRLMLRLLNWQFLILHKLLCIKNMEMQMVD